MVQDIKITPSGAGDKIPQMLFTGSGATAPNMELNVRPDSRLSYESTDGEVFSISPGLQSGVIFAVKDISGLDQISINASGDTYLAPYYGNVRVGATGVIHEDYALDVQGKGLRVGASGTVLTRASAPAVTTDTLYNVGGSLYFDGSTVGGGSAAGAIHQIQYNADGTAFGGDSQFLFSKANAAFTNDRVMVVSGVIIANSGDAHYTNPISIGSGAYIGYGATTPASQAADCIVIGTKARSGKGSRSVVIGAHAYDQSTHTTGENVVIGDGANVHTDAYRSISIGNAATTTGFMNITIGHNAQLIQGQDECIAIGTYAGQNGESAATHSICLGNETTSKGHCGIAIGNDAHSYAYLGIGIGRASRAGTSASLNSGTGSVAIGDATYAGSHAVALGYRAKAPAGGFVVASGSALTDVLLSGVMKDHLTMPNGQQFIQMATAAQTTDLMQWQNSAGTNVAAMTPSGVLNVYDIRTSGVTVCIGKNAVVGTNHPYAYDIAIGSSAYAVGGDQDGIAIGTSSRASGKRTIAIGTSSYTNTNQAAAIGHNSRAEGYNSLALGYNTKAYDGQSIAIGNSATVGDGTTADFGMAIGQTATSDAFGAIALGGYADVSGERSVAIGFRAKAEGTSWVIASGVTSAEVGISGVFGSYTAIPNDQKLAVGGDVPTYTVDALGHDAWVRGTGVIVGASGIVFSDGSTQTAAAAGGSAAGAIHQVQYNSDGSSFGGDAGFTYYKDKAGFQNDRTLVVSGVIIASSGDANYKNSITIGSGVYQSNPDGGTMEENIIIGTQAWAKNAHNNIIIGRTAYAKSDNSNSSQYNVIVGYNANVRDYHAYNNVVIGREAFVGNRGDDNVVIGYGAKSGTEHEAQSVYIGKSAGNPSYSDGASYVVCVGGSTAAHGVGAVAMGIEARAQGEHAISLGFSAGGNFAGNYSSSSPRYGAINLGAYTHADGPMSIAIGHRVVAPTKHFVLGSGSAQESVMLSGVFGSYLALPNGQQFRQIASAAQTSDLTQWQNSAGTNVAAMTPSGILNVYDIRTSGTTISLGQGAAGTGSTAVAIGYNSTASAAGTVSLGYDAQATASYAITIGNSARGDGQRAVVIGDNADTNNNNDTVVIGRNSDATGSSAVAIGRNANAVSTAVALGTYSYAAGTYATALGAYTDATGERSVAIGYEAQAHGTSWVIASGDTSAEVGISGVFGSYVAIPNDQQLAVGSNVPQYAIDVVRHSGVIRASGVKGHISTNPDAATVTFDLNAATTHAVTLGGNRIMAVSNASVGDKFLTRLQQDATGSRTVTWFSNIKWAGGTAPTLTTTAHKADLLGFLAASGDGGSNIWYDGFVVGQNI